MRAICGAIITAGALIGLGLVSIGIGTRYAALSHREPAGTLEYIPLMKMDSGLLLCLFCLIAFALVGLGIAFLGLAYHHHRRFHEHLHSLPPNNTGSRVVV
jgi:hypothetical protein